MEKYKMSCLLFREWLYKYFCDWIVDALDKIIDDFGKHRLTGTYSDFFSFQYALEIKFFFISMILDIFTISNTPNEIGCKFQSQKVEKSQQKHENMSYLLSHHLASLERSILKFLFINTNNASAVFIVDITHECGKRHMYYHQSYLKI